MAKVIQLKLDYHQFGNIKQSSTGHLLVDFISYVILGVEGDQI